MFYTLSNVLSYSPLRYLIYFLDIIAVASLLYLLYILMNKTRVYSIAIGIFFIAMLTLVSKGLGLSTLTWIFNKFFQIGIIAVVILFQSEIKHGLRVLGGSTVFRRTLGYNETHIQKVINAVFNLSNKGFGALIVFQKKASLHTFMERSIIIDAQMSSELIETIFYKNNPLHDGAIIVTQDRLAAASVYLPLTDIEPTIKNRRLGTRHRAALGMSEQTDAVIVVVSEETQSVSIVHEGILQYNLSKEAVNKKLEELLKIK